MAIEVRCPSCSKLLRVKDSAAGKTGKCPSCGNKVKVPEPTYEAEEYDDSYDFDDGGASDSYGGGYDDDYGGGYDDYGYDDEPMQDAPPLPPDRRPCPVCGEMIMPNAAKCRYCGEIFDETLKKKKRRKKKRRSSSSGYDEDSDLSPGEWVLCIICANIACILGIIYMIQGKPKGLKMVGVSLLGQVFWAVISLMIEAANQ